MEFIISLLPTMKSTTCVSSQAGRQMRWEEEGEEEEEEEEEGEEEEEETPENYKYGPTWFNEAPGK